MFGWFRKRTGEDAVQELHARVAEASRSPHLYLALGVADSVEGRLESLTLHATLVLKRLQALPDPGPAAAQDFVDVLFRNVDAGLRELGVGDVTVPKRMKKIAQGFYGRAQAYTAAIAAGDAEALAGALERNIPGADGAALAAAALAADRRLGALDLEGLFKEPDLFGYQQA